MRLMRRALANMATGGYLVNAFDTSKHLYRNKLINSLSINLGVCFQIKGW